MKLSLQDQYGQTGICYGCGPANEKGLKIQSFVVCDRVIAHWKPEPHHHAFQGVLNGGIIGTILDCHCNWAASWYLMQENQLERPPCTVTAEYTIKLKRPTPVDEMLTLCADLVEVKGNKAVIKGELKVGDEVCDTCLATFIAVSDDHPAAQRW